ncbi:MAG TPA: alpha/beta fold hydrolase [Thermodesulfobacteriota bacterium]|nr:alpha/beta fold hydrolase [Thermodesulfobacteriota bacterium]
MEKRMSRRKFLKRPLLFMVLWLGAIGVLSGSVGAQDLNRKEGNFVVRDFRFQSGEVLPELRLHYVTLGTPRRDAAGHTTNAVLLLHGTTGRGESLLASFAAQLFAEGQPLDAGRYYLIIPDSIGHGSSTKPSDGLRGRFPRYGYNDMVEAQHRLVTEGLGVDHLRLVLGTSMGGMHTWLWGEKYPDMMDTLMPIASQPVQIAGRNFLWRHVITETIRNDPEWNGGDYEKQPSHWVSVLPLFNIMLLTPVQLQVAGPTRDKANELFDKIIDTWCKTLETNDFLYAFESSWDYDPEPNLGKIKAKLLALNFADDTINPVEIDVMGPAVAKIPNGRLITMPASNQSLGHMNLFHPEIWKHHLAEFLKSLP